MKFASLAFTLLSTLVAHVSFGAINNGDNNDVEYLVTHGETIYGDTDINHDYNDVILRLGRDIVHYPPNQIEKIAVIEGNDAEVQLYYSGMFGLNSKRYLFKILAEGKRTLLFREGLKFSEFEDTEYPPFFVLAEGQIYALSANKKELLKQISDAHQKELSGYIKAQGIDLQDKEDLIKLFNYYNVLAGKK